MNDDPIKSRIKTFILEEFLPGEKPEVLTDDTALVSEGILDSLATLRMVSFLEQEFSISLEPHEVDTEYLNTLDSITALVRSKTG